MKERLLLVGQEIRIKAGETDAMGVVSDIGYATYFEHLRHVFPDRYYPLAEMMPNSISPVLMNTGIRNHRPLTIHSRPVGR